MEGTTTKTLRWGLWLLVAVVVGTSEASLAVSYCSSDQNSGGYPTFYSDYMSTGLCGDHCQGSYAFAVVQGNACWCSNYVPVDQEDTYSCSSGCPGITSEWCGNTESGLYGYFALPGGKPLGTSGSGSSNNAPSTSSSVSTTRSSGSSPIPSSSRAPSSSVWYSSRPSPASLVTVVPPQESVQTVAPSSVFSHSPDSTSQAPSSIYVPPSSSYTPPPPSSTSSPSPSPSYSSFSSETPTSSTQVPTEIYTSITTVTGRVQTVIITPTASATSDATLGQSSTSGGHGVSTGKVVGIVLGVALGIGLIIGILVWLWFRRKRRHDMRDLSPEGSFVADRSGGISSGGNSVPSRQVSQMSTSGLLGKAPRLNTVGLVGGSDLRSADTTGSGFDRRSVGTDQRLNPWALYTQEDRNISSVSLQDNQDYSRQLRVANPDS